MFSNLLKHIDLIQTNKDNILDTWMNYQVVQERLNQNNFNILFFKEKFAVKVFDFAFGVVKNKHEVGECPVIGVMLILFKKKNIPLSDIFIICVHLKNALLHFFDDNAILDEKTIKELSILMDYNFEGVITEYVKLYYNDSREISKKESNTCSTIQTSERQEKKTPLPKEETLSCTTAKEYIEEVNVDMSLIDELHELESDTLNAIDADEILCANSLSESSNLFEQYAKVLNTLYEFEELSYTLTILKDLLINTEFDTIDKETNYIIGIYLKAIISDLQSWRMSIFITKEAEDIHYLDKTLLSSIAQLQITLMPTDEGQEDEIEFF